MHEIEKKFIIKNIPFDLSCFRSSEIHQCYVAVEENYSEVRIRNIDKQYFLTIKSVSTFIRFEEELPLEPVKGEQLIELFKERGVNKTRYFIPCQEFMIELDLYKGQLEGLMIAEVEFKSPEEAIKFIKPAWFGEDVTYDDRYKNRNLALYGLK